MKQQFLTHIEVKKLFAPDDNILLAVSGGIDSQVMLHLFHQTHFKCNVAHANFQLRGEESDEDERFVKEICAQLSVPFFTKKFETQHYADEHKLSIQMAARDLRYQWFEELAKKNNFHSICTAHHLNDSVETILLNLTRGAGLEGHDGIAAVNKKIIRPLLFATRQEIETYAKENNIQWREDRSNADDYYQRNFIRHRVVPLLKELNPSLEKSVSESSAKISGSIALMEWGMKSWKEKFQTENGTQIVLNKKGLDVFENPESVLWNLIKCFGFNFDQCRQMVKAMKQSGKIFLAARHTLVIDRDELIISENKTALNEVTIEIDQRHALLGKQMLHIERNENIEIKNDLSMAQLDASKLMFPLRWRKWKSGDSFFPLGMNHTKKISDFLIDQKISLADKSTITVVESGNEIVWLVGLRMDDRYKITPATRASITLSVSTVE